jgi:hypothetical protein
MAQGGSPLQQRFNTTNVRGWRTLVVLHLPIFVKYF